MSKKETKQNTNTTPAVDALDKAKKMIEESISLYRKGNLSEAESLRGKVNTILDGYAAKLAESTFNLYGKDKNFGIIHAVIESASPLLYKTNEGKKAIAEYVKLVKEDKNLQRQYALYSELSSAVDVPNLDAYINEAIAIAKENTTRKSILESNQKLIDFIKKHNIEEDVEMTDEELNLYESIGYLVANEKTISNLADHAWAMDNIKRHMQERIEESKANAKLSEKAVTTESIEESMNKIVDGLNESEKELVLSIKEAKESNNKEKLHQIFNELKESALSALDEVISESTEDAGNFRKLIALRSKISMRPFNESTMSKDIVEMLEIKNTLADGE